MFRDFLSNSGKQLHSLKDGDVNKDKALENKPLVPQRTKKKFMLFTDVSESALDPILGSLLDVKSVVSLSRCSSSLLVRTVKKSYWQNNLLALGCEPEVLSRVFRANVQNFKKLYQMLLCFYEPKNEMSAWEMCCLSGELDAIKNIRKIELFLFNKQGVFRNRLNQHLFSGSLDIMKYASEVLKIDPKSTTIQGENALHFAACSGSVESMKYAYEVLKIDPKSVTRYGENALDFAAGSGSVAALKYALEVLNLDPNKSYAIGYRVLLKAAWGDSVEAVRFVRLYYREFDLKLSWVHLHRANCMGYQDRSEPKYVAIDKVLNMPLEKLLSESPPKKIESDSNLEQNNNIQKEKGSFIEQHTNRCIM